MCSYPNPEQTDRTFEVALTDDQKDVFRNLVTGNSDYALVASEFDGIRTGVIVVRDGNGSAAPVAVLLLANDDEDTNELFERVTDPSELGGSVEVFGQKPEPNGLEGMDPDAALARLLGALGAQKA